MFYLSLTACSFYLKKTNSKGYTNIYALNKQYDIQRNGEKVCTLKDMAQLFPYFFKKYEVLYKDNNKQQSFSCEYNTSNYRETEDFKMIYAKIYSGTYGSASDILDGETQKVKYKKQASDIENKPFYLMIVFPKDSKQVSVQKGMFIFQNVGPFGIKTITTSLMQEFFSTEFGITLVCRTIAPELFVRKVIRNDNIKKLIMVKNVKSRDLSDNIGIGYGSEIREISGVKFSDENAWNRFMNAMRYVAGSRFHLFEFDNTSYDTLKVVVDIGGRQRKIDLHNLDRLSIIESIPDEIRMADGHPDVKMLIEYFTKVATEYLKEMVLEIT